MDFAANIERAAFAKQMRIHEVTERGDSDIQLFYSNVNVFVTGGSGFIGKQLIEKLLRSCKINRIYFLLRPKKEKIPKERLKRILDDQLYDLLRKKDPNFADRVIGVEGDISKIKLGLADDDWKLLTKEVNIIFHAAATIRFDEPLKNAIITNIRGTREVMRLGKQCEQLKSFVHVSTAFCHTTITQKEVLEEFYPALLPPETLIQLAERLDEKCMDKIANIFLEGWPNSYTFTKSITEELVRTMSGDMPTSIVRPPVVLGVYREPMPGWLDLTAALGPGSSTLGIGLGIVHVILYGKETRVDIAPVDYVNNAVIAAGWDAAVRRHDEPTIYTVTNIDNCMTWAKLLEIMFGQVYSTMATPKAVWYPFVVETSNKTVFILCDFFFHCIPAYCMDILCLLIGRKRRFVKLYKKMYSMFLQYEYFFFNDWHFGNKNIQELHQKMSTADKIIYNFDVNSIDWIEYMYTFTMGIRKYILKDDLKDTGYALKKRFAFKILHYTLIFIGLYVLSNIMLACF